MSSASVSFCFSWDVSSLALARFFNTLKRRFDAKRPYGEQNWHRQSFRPFFQHRPTDGLSKLKPHTKPPKER